MSVSLYRKYRPEAFEKVLGQDHVVTALQSAIKSGNVSHAYLFAGSRGTGKTSVARIFARELGTTPNDIYEIDAASNNGVDEIRELRDGVNTLPFDSKYKVYILDEVHMLSKAAFNALLKTLEEPPAHVIFILATTELHKVLDTVKSRCQVFEFKKPTIEILREMIIAGGKNEGVTIEPDAADMIAKRGDGAYRDTWGIVERIIASSSNKKITTDDIESVLSTPHGELVIQFVTAVVAKNLESAIKIINQVKQENHSVSDFLEEMIEICRLVLLTRFAPEFAATLSADLNPDRLDQIKTWTGEKNIINSELLVEFIRLLGETKKSSVEVIPVELALIRLIGKTTE
ncbi:MAG: polymerase subunit gamma and tau, polymerase subunit gamma/tau protein [Patescibacteria group bacterium]|nr:polymerase subunit gamma and tau, polymerase subunit gamma/tau protein [Patescibacteria group bacterium]